MKIMNRSLSLMYLLLIFSVAKIHGQVTVGSDIEPRKGTILDIKDKNTSDHLPNADGGLGLPRVKLVAPETLTIGNDESQKSKHAAATRAEQIAAIQKYAKAIADSLIAGGYDGLDIDYEPQAHNAAELVSHPGRNYYFIIPNSITICIHRLVCSTVSFIISF